MWSNYPGSLFTEKINPFCVFYQTKKRQATRIVKMRMLKQKKCRLSADFLHLHEVQFDRFACSVSYRSQRMSFSATGRRKRQREDSACVLVQATISKHKVSCVFQRTILALTLWLLRTQRLLLPTSETEIGLNDFFCCPFHRPNISFPNEKSAHMACSQTSEKGEKGGFLVLHKSAKHCFLWKQNRKDLWFANVEVSRCAWELGVAVAWSARNCLSWLPPISCHYLNQSGTSFL